MLFPVVLLRHKHFASLKLVRVLNQWLGTSEGCLTSPERFMGRAPCPRGETDAPSVLPKCVLCWTAIAKVHVSLEAAMQHTSVFQRACVTTQRCACSLSLPQLTPALNFPNFGDVWASLCFVNGICFSKCSMKDLVYLHGACLLEQLLSTVQHL